MDQRKGKERMFQILQCLNINKIHKPVMHVQNVCCPHFPRLCFFETEACFNYRRPRTRIEIVKSQIIIDDKGRVLKTKVPQLVSSLHKRNVDPSPSVVEGLLFIYKSDGKSTYEPWNTHSFVSPVLNAN